MPKSGITGRKLSQVRVALPTGPDAVQLRVCCTRREQHVTLQECLQCPRLAELQHVDGLPSAVFCDAGVEHEASERELSLRVPSVEAVMSRSFTCVRADLGLDAATELLLAAESKVLPVVDELGALLGFVREEDVQLDVHARGDVGAPSRCVGDVMTPSPLVIPERSPLTRAAGALAYERQSQAVVAARDGTLLGVISAEDILRWLARADGYLL